MSPIKRTVIATLIACSLTPVTAGAVGLGEIRITSKLGDRFHAEIPLLNSSPSIVPSCFNLTFQAADAMADVPWLKDAQIALMSSPPRLVISSRRQVVDPVVQLAIYTGCGTYLTRHYTALMSPPEEVKALPMLAPVTAARREDAFEGPHGQTVSDRGHAASSRMARAGETASDMARRLYPRSPRTQQRFIRRMIALNPEWLSSVAGDEVLPDGVELRYPAPPARSVVAVRPKIKTVAKSSKTVAVEASKDRLVLTPSDEPLAPVKSAATVGSGEIDSRLVDVEQQIVAMRSQLTALHAEYPTPLPAMQTVFVEMESRLLAVELNVARIKLSSLAAEAQAKVPVADTSANAAGNEKADSVPVSPPIASVSPPAPKAEARPSAPVADQGQPYALGTGLAALGIFGLGLGTYLFRRARRVKVGTTPGGSLNNPPRVGVHPKRELPEQRTIAPLDIDLDDTPIAKPAQIDKMPTRVFKEPRKEEMDFSPIELANIMLSFGRAQGAVEVLQDFIKDSPAESLQPGLRLLEIYKQTEMRREFEQMAGQLAHRFNVERVHWNQDFLPATETPAVSMDSSRTPVTMNVMPTHIKARIAANWGTSECLDYLHALLRDTRGGARKGFSVLVTQEILGVIKTLEEKMKSRKTA
ncbi:hypothetical protein [Propionivibrio sp.]|uniref:type IV pilus assembly protein FimV n=1 Tax=Propionivibrio sp. TaxID=2212460 RepID=UPI0025F9DFDC|nr:hypothetical protein [Propionivibrio sp.]MBK8400668.1 hypothetical protein [Propionivibrio sp.]MBK8745473.1 hypothetical protein [Propionivibrio sp.]MBK8893663.1 hypothetical protein [Propionivibrio sp.]MBL0207027.1 hypothetical protein [Propionivibrio sp.]